MVKTGGRVPEDDREGRVVRRGFGLKSEVEDILNKDYHSPIIEEILKNGNRWQVGGLKLRLAEAFGFCYGVDKAIAFAYETQLKYSDKRIFLTNEIIHNPRVNRRMLEMGIKILTGPYTDGTTLEDIRPDDIVLLPAFGVDEKLLRRLKSIGCLLVDTTCGSVVTVWKRVQRYARDGFTAMIHGKYFHEETLATCSHVTTYEGGQYIILRDREEAGEICEFIRTGQGREALAEKYRHAISPGFDFHRHLERLGCANQTTMLSSESLAVAEMFRQAMIDRYGEAVIEEHFRSFDTVCNATQERQDSVMAMMENPPDLMLVVGGFNSSNTSHLNEIASKYCPSYHVDDVHCMISPRELRYRPARYHAQIEVAKDWLPSRRPLEIGLTGGASTPNKVIGEVIEKLIEWEETGQAGG